MGRTPAAFELARRDPNAVMASVHADSLILDPEEFRHTLAAALQVAAQADQLVVLGIPPTEPTTQLGYIWRGDQVGRQGAYTVHQVRRFV